MRPRKDHSDGSLAKVLKEIYAYLYDQNYKPTLHILDNECLKESKICIKKEKVAIQLVVPHNHRVNAAEPVLKTAKYHLIASLSTVTKQTPLQFWCAYLPQVEMTLNMLRTSRRDPSKSA